MANVMRGPSEGLRVLAIIPGFIPSAIIQIIKPFLALHRRGALQARIRLESQVSLSDIEWASILILCRIYQPQYSGLVQQARARGKLYIYDLDDDLLHLPVDVPVEETLRQPASQQQLREYVAGATLVRVYAEPLQHRLLELNPHVVIARTAFDFDLLPSQPTARKSNEINIVYATSRTQDALADLFLADVVELLQRYRRGVTVHFWGYYPPQLQHQPQVTFRKIVRAYDRFIQQFARAGFDIGLAPLYDDEFHRSKTNNKFREYGGCGIAGIYSNVSVYASSVVNEHTGLLVDQTPGAWLQALTRLIEEPELRRHIQSQAREVVRAQYAQPLVEAEWLEHLHHTLQQPVPPLAPAGTHAKPESPFFHQSTLSGYGRTWYWACSVFNSVLKRGWPATFDGVSDYIWRWRYQKWLNRVFDQPAHDAVTQY